MVNKNIFITGATGFIGQNLISTLRLKNKVFALVRKKSLGKIKNFPEKGVQIVRGDLLDSNSYSDILDNIDYIFHLAALFKLDASKEELFQHNVLATENLFRCCLGKNIKKIIYFSTAYVLGRKEKKFMKEDEPYPEKFKNWYEWSKAESEKIALSFYREYNLPVIIVRPVIVYGPKSFYGFYKALSLIFGGSLKVLAYNVKIHLVSVYDVVGAVVHLAELENNQGEIYNISDDTPYTCKELAEFICQEFNIKSSPLSLPKGLLKLLRKLPLSKFFLETIPPWLIDYFLYEQTYSNEKLKRTGYKFYYPDSLIGLKNTINWYLNNNYLTKR